jgi:hypothetical protein
VHYVGFYIAKGWSAQTIVRSNGKDKVGRLVRDSHTSKEKGNSAAVVCCGMFSIPEVVFSCCLNMNNHFRIL